MYEFRGGTGRLVTALYYLKSDQSRLTQLANLIHYYHEQLEQDITAAVDFFEAFRDMERPSAEE